MRAGTPVKLKLKKEAQPFYSRAYTVPKAFEALVKNEMNDLVEMSVLIENVRTEYCSPSFLGKRRMGVYAS